MLSLWLRLLWPYRIYGREHLPRRGPAVIVANHTSYLDPVFLYALAPTKPRFMVWTAHYRLPVLGWLYRLLRAIPVDIWSDTPTPISHRAYRTALEHLNQGGILAIFPEGARTPDGRFLKWRVGAARLALAARAPIIPITFNGLYHIWPPYRTLPRRGRVEIHVHPPLQPSYWNGLPRREAALRWTRQVRDLVALAYHLPPPEDQPPPDWENPYLTDPIARRALEEDQPRYASGE